MLTTDLEYELTRALFDVVLQNCRRGDLGLYDSNYVPTNARALRLLAKVGVMQIVKDNGQHVVTARVADFLTCYRKAEK